MTNTLAPDERRQAARLALEIAALIREHPAALSPGAMPKAPFVRAAMIQAMYLVGLEKLLTPEPAPGNGEETG